MKTFERAWAETGRRYGREALQNVRLGWEMAQTELAAERDAFRRALEEIRDDEIPGDERDVFDFAGQLAEVRDYAEKVLGEYAPNKRTEEPK